MVPLASRASTACWRSWRLFLARKLVHWWASWGLWMKIIPTPSSTVLVARQEPSRLRQCRAKAARRARKNWSCDSVLWTVVLEGESKRSNTEVLAWFFLVEEVVFVLVLLLSVDFWTKVTDKPAILSVCRMVQTLFRRTLGSGPRTWGPSEGAVLTWIRTCGWKLKFLNRTSPHSNCRLEAAAKLAETAETWASWMIANLSRSNLVLWFFRESSSITEATIESAMEA